MEANILYEGHVAQLQKILSEIDSLLLRPGDVEAPANRYAKDL